MRRDDRGEADQQDAYLTRTNCPSDPNGLLLHYLSFGCYVNLAKPTTKPSERTALADWVATAKGQITQQTIRNSWRHGAYTYFPPTCEENSALAMLEMVSVMAMTLATLEGTAMTV